MRTRSIAAAALRARMSASSPTQRGASGIQETIPISAWATIGESQARISPASLPSLDQAASCGQHAAGQRLDRRPLLVGEIGDLAQHRLLDPLGIEAAGDEVGDPVERGARPARGGGEVARQRLAGAPIALEDQVLPVVGIIIDRRARQAERRGEIDQGGLRDAARVQLPRRFVEQQVAAAALGDQRQLLLRLVRFAASAICLLGTRTYAYVKTLDKPVFTWRDANILKCQIRSRRRSAVRSSGNGHAIGRGKMKACRLRRTLLGAAAGFGAPGWPRHGLAQDEPCRQRTGESPSEDDEIHRHRAAARAAADRRRHQHHALLREQLIEESRISQIENIAAAVPNVDIKEQVPGAIPVVTIRGIGLDDFSATNSPSAGVYVDEVPLASTALMSSEIYDLERIEVLKGPQGTLYGRNSTAGALNIITARPQTSSPPGSQRRLRQLRHVRGRGLSQRPALRHARDADLGAHRAAGRRLLAQPPAARRDARRARHPHRPRCSCAGGRRSDVDVNLKVEGLRSDSEMGQGEFFGAVNPLTGGPCAPVLAGRIDNSQCTDFFGYTDTDGDPFLGDWPRDALLRYRQLGRDLAGRGRSRRGQLCARSPAIAGRTAASTSIPTRRPRARSISSRTTRSSSSPRSCTWRARPASPNGWSAPSTRMTR